MRHVLFNLDEITDRQDPREKELAEHHEYVSGLANTHNEHEFLRVLSEQIARNSARVYGGLLYGILTYTDVQAYQFYSRMLDLILSGDDSYVFNKLHIFLEDADLITCRPFRCLRNHTRTKIVEFLDRLADRDFARVQPLLVLITRQIRSGDLGAENIALARGVINILRKHRTRITPGSELVPATVFSFIRLLADHEREPKLRELELDYVSYMLRNRFRECTRIGRDLLRVMMSIKDIPVIREILLDMQNSPQKLDPSFNMPDLLATPSEPWLTSQRITREMDTKIRFILDKIKGNIMSKPLANYRHSHLIHNGNESANVDVVRFICTAVQPPNTILSSNIAQRWQVIMTLLAHIKSDPVRQDAKLALLFDWLHWNPDRDNIMYIEPAMLMMEKACQPGFELTGLAGDTIEYLYLLVNNYIPEKAAEWKRNVNFAMHSLVKFGVTRSLRKIYNAEALVDGPGREQLQSLFPQFVHLQDGQRPSIALLSTGVALPVQTTGPAAVDMPPSADPGRVDQAMMSQLVEALNTSVNIDAPSIQQLLNLFVGPSAQASEAQQLALRHLLRGRHAEVLWRELITRFNQQPANKNSLLALIAGACASDPEIGVDLCSYTLRHGLNAGVDNPKGLYQALSAQMNQSFHDHMIKDLETLLHRHEESSVPDFVPQLYTVFSDARQDLRFIELILSVMNFGLCASICDQLTQGECTILDLSKMSFLIERSLAEFDEISVMFLWKFIVAQAGADPETVDSIVRQARLTGYAVSPATCEGLFQLLISTAPSPTTVAFAATLPYNRFAALTRIWRQKRFKPIRYTESLAGALENLSKRGHLEDLKTLLDQLIRMNSNRGNHSADVEKIFAQKNVNAALRGALHHFPDSGYGVLCTS
ncbi:Integrator complex subunit 3 [Geranomyces variabilis]|uniref:Integrator complex subunit 3 n=1 Tax=Geranomyces variabilis TaxID=109894 RepID=A0AAD5TRG9_9FUNG|nr:Integrator complex subunit 3 [Geranomyces variabilis]